MFFVGCLTIWKITSGIRRSKTKNAKCGHVMSKPQKYDSYVDTDDGF